MVSTHQASAGRVLALSLMLALWAMLAPNAWPDDVKPTVEGQAPAAKQGGTKNLVMAMRAPTSLRKDVLQEILDRPVKSANKDKNTQQVLFNWNKTHIKPISKEVYDELAELIISGFIRPKAGPSEGVAVEPYRDKDLTWIISLGDPNLFLKKLTIKYAEDGKDKEEVFDPRDKRYAKNPKENPLRLHSPGKYTLRLDPKIHPKSYLAIVTDDPLTEAGKEMKEMPWPETTDRYWLIEFAGFDGSLNALLAVLQDESKLDTPFRDISAAKASTVLVGSLLPDLVRPDIEFDDKNNVTFRFPIRGKKEDRISRVWMLFPVPSEQESKALLKKWSALTPGNVIKEIDKDARKITVKTTAALMPKMLDDPLWIEIPKVGGAFERTLPLDNIAEWKKLKDPKVWRLLVWEYESEAKEELNGQLVPIRLAKQFEIDKNPAWVFSEEMVRWPIGLKEVKDKPAP